MKLLLFFLLPCVAFARVGESLDEFKKRSEAVFEVEKYGQLFRATAFIDKIEVELIGKDGIIFFERYRGLNKEQAKSIVGKLPNKFQVIEKGEETEWRDAIAKLSCFFEKDILLIRYDSATRFAREVDRARYSDKPAGQKMERF